MTQVDSAINILIVDDHKLSNECLKLGLEKESDMRIVGQAFDGVSAVEMAKALRPDVILMDVCMPNQNGIQATAVIKKILPDTKVVMTTSMMDKKVVQAAFAANADGYCTKEAQLSQLVQMIRAIIAGETVCVDPLVALYAIREIAGVQDVGSINTVALKPVGPLQPEQPQPSRQERKPEPLSLKPVFCESPFANVPVKENVSIEKPKPMGPLVPEKKPSETGFAIDDNVLPPVSGKLGGLTRQELEILKLIADNNSPEQMYEKTGLSAAWLAKHVKAILLKLSASDEAQAIQRALQEGLIEDAPLLYRAE